jgi:citrate lyase gamma subunit
MKISKSKLREIIKEELLKEFNNYDVEASVDRDRDYVKHAELKMAVEEALDEEGQDWVLEMDEWSDIIVPRDPADKEEFVAEMNAALEKLLGTSVKELLSNEN